MSSGVTALFRLVLPFLLLALCAWLVIAHGVRGLALIMAVVLVSALPQTRAYRMGERVLVRLTGSRRRALVVFTVTVIVLLIAVNVYEFVHH